MVATAFSTSSSHLETSFLSATRIQILYLYTGVVLVHTLWGGGYWEAFGQGSLKIFSSHMFKYAVFDIK